MLDADAVDPPTPAARAEENWAYSVGVQNYVFGLPLLIFERERSLRLDPVAVAKARRFAPAAPINQIGHMKTLATAADTMPYTPNNDTVYSGAVLELAGGPIILTAPDIPDRYWSVEFADCYTNNLFYVGSRATGGKGGHHALVGPGWTGEIPAGVIEHRVPNNSAMLAIRIAALPDNPTDLAEVNALQDLFTLTSLNRWDAPDGLGQADVPTLAPRPHHDGELAFFQDLADLLVENPPPPEHAAAALLLSRGGITIGEPFDPADLPEPTRNGLIRAALDGPQLMDWKVKYRGTPYPTRWNNLRPGSYGYDYFDRAAGALEGLFVHDRQEAEYFSTYEDGDGVLLDGAGRYVLHFAPGQLPQTLPSGFWSVTMYGPNFQLVDNPIARYSIGDRTPGLSYNADGSLDIHMAASAPPAAAVNWLPSPQRGLFRLNYRVYLPAPVMQDPTTLGSYLPPIRKL